MIHHLHYYCHVVVFVAASIVDELVERHLYSIHHHGMEFHCLFDSFYYDDYCYYSSSLRTMMMMMMMMMIKVLTLLVVVVVAPFQNVFLPLTDLVPAMIFHRRCYSRCHCRYFSLVVNPHPSMARATSVETTKKKKTTY